MPANPTNQDVINQVVDLHDCLEKNADASVTRDDALAEQIEAVSALMSVGHATLNQKIDDGWREFNKTAWKAVGAIALAILVAALGGNIFLSSNVASKSDVASKAALRYTSDDAARDRAAQAQIDQQILAELDRLKASK